MEYKHNCNIYNFEGKYDIHLSSCLPNFSIPFEVVTHASMVVVGIVLS